MSTNLDGLKDKVVLITGASSGIGAETALYLAKLGCRLLLSGRNAANLEETAKRCREVGGLSADQLECTLGDVCKAADCESIVQKAVTKFGCLDVLVNNAGILVTGTIEDCTEEDYERQMDSNVRSVFLMTKAAIPHLVISKGNIVNVSSVAGLRAFPGICVYNMSKACLDQMTRSVALELAPKGVRVNSVNPGVIITDIHKRGGMNEEQYQKYLEHGKSTHALGRVGTSDEVAASIAFLASPMASFITGTLLSVDGGRGIMCPR